MKKIKKIDIVTSQGGNTYIVGRQGIASIIETGRQISNDHHINVFQCLDADGDVLAEINRSVPYVVEYEK